MTVEDSAAIQALEKENRILQKKLARSQRHTVELDAVNQQQESILRRAFQEVEASKQQLTQLNEQLEQRVEQRTAELMQAMSQLQHIQLQVVQHEKMSALGNLIAGVAHEINNPIGFISGNLDQADQSIQALIEHLNRYREQFPDAGSAINDHAEEIDLAYLLEDLPDMLRSMRVGCDRIKHLSTSLRIFSRADTDRKVEADLHEGIESTLTILQHRLKATETRPAIQVVRQYGDLPKVKCFLGQLNQVFMNLLANAIDALEEFNQNRTYQAIKANPNHITIQTTLDDHAVKISIADNGGGISETIKARIFDHLFTTKAIGQGTGLGLSIAHQIVVEKHEGTIEVISEPGKGTEFVITLPI